MTTLLDKLNRSKQTTSQLEDEYFDYIFNDNWSWTYKFMNIIQNDIFKDKIYYDSFIESPHAIFKRLFCNDTKEKVTITSNKDSEMYFKEDFWNNVRDSRFHIAEYLDIIFTRFDEDCDDPTFLYYSIGNGDTTNISDNMIAELALNLMKVHKTSVFM